MRLKALAKKIILAVILCIAIIAYLLYRNPIHSSYEHPQVSSDPVHVTTYVVKKAPLAETIQTNGQIKAIQAINIHSKVAGYITHIYVHEGQQVKQGQLLIALDHAVDQDTMKQKQAAMALAQSNYQRALKVVKSGAISQQNLDQLQSTYLQAKADYATAADTLKYKLIYAPFTGIIGAIHLVVGNYITTTQSITTLTNLTHLQANYSLGANYFSATHMHEPIAITAINNASQQVTAHISYISATVDAKTQTFDVHAKFSNQKNLFAPGETALITQTIAINPNGITVPLEAVMTSLTGNSVYVIHDHHAVKRQVSLGLTKQNSIQILHGLAPGDRIILSTVQVHDGSAVTWQ